jgi:glycosyltransferase involved in cell wall biosynthesis
MAERDLAVQALTAQMAERDLAVQALTAQMAERDSAVQALTAQMAERDLVVHTLTAQMAEKEQAVQALTAQVAEREQVEQGLVEKNNEMNQELDEIKSSTAWHLIQILWRLRVWLAPSGSNREKLARYFMRGLRSLRNNRQYVVPKIIKQSGRLVKISIVITTHNHEKYITQCLESILCQKGDFQMEIIIGDDCSTDDTRAIAQQFQDKNPGIISLLPPEKNLGVTKNLERCLNACSGNYIAICEGDDYWTDAYKLQKQKDLLELNKDFSMCFSAIMLYYEEENILVPHHDQVSLKKDFITIEDLIEINYIGNFSCCMYRTDVLKRLPEGIFNLYAVDWLFNMACGQMGKIGFLRDRMSVYRLHSSGAWTGKSELEKMKELCHYIDVYNKFFDYKYDALFKKRKTVAQNEITRIQSLQEVEKTSGKRH